MKILHIAHAYYPHVGGVETSARQIAEGSAARGHEVTMLCFDDKNEKEVVNGVNVIRVKPLFRVGSASISWRYFREYMRLSKDADIIHFHVPNPMGELPFCLLKRGKARTLCTYHLDPVRPKAFVFLYTRLLNWFIRFAYFKGIPTLLDAMTFLPEYSLVMVDNGKTGIIVPLKSWPRQ